MRWTPRIGKKETAEQKAIARYVTREEEQEREVTVIKSEHWCSWIPALFDFYTVLDILLRVLKRPMTSSKTFRKPGHLRPTVHVLFNNDFDELHEFVSRHR